MNKYIYTKYIMSIKQKSNNIILPYLKHINNLKIINSISLDVAKNIIKKLLQIRDSTNKNSVAKTFNNYSRQEQIFIYTICTRLGLKYIPGISPKVDRCIIPKNKEILIQLIHTPKCGGTSIKYNLNKLNNYFEPGAGICIFPQKFKIKNKKGYTIVITNGHLPARNFTPNAIRVAFGRDPINRFESAFKYIKVGSNINNTKLEFKRWDSILQKYKYPTKLLESSSDFKNITNLDTGIEHLFPLKYWWCDNNNNILIDYLIRQENLQNDWCEFCSLIGIDHLDIKLEHNRKTNITTDNHNYKIKQTDYDKKYPNDRKIYNIIIKNHHKMKEQVKFKLNKQFKF